MLPATTLNVLFFVNIAWFATHELDAIYRHEWRTFQSMTPWLGRLSDLDAYRLFTLLHIPLTLAIIWAAQYPLFQIGFDLFLIVHVGLHWLYRHHEHNEFEGWFSWALIVGAGLFGALHLVLLLTTSPPA